MLTRTKTTSTFKEPDTFTLELKENNYFCILIKQVIQGHVTRKKMHFDLEDFKSNDINIKYSNFLLQLGQIYCDEIKGLSFSAINDTFDFVEYGTSNFLKNNKSFDPETYHMANSTLGLINFECKVTIKNIYFVDDRTTKVESFTWEDLDFDPSNMGGVCNHHRMSWRSWDETMFNKAIDFIISRYESYKGSNKWDDDEGSPFANLLNQEAQDNKQHIGVRSTFYTNIKYSDLEGDQKIIDGLIDGLIKRFQTLKNLKY
jgi:hypothetical protein